MRYLLAHNDPDRLRPLRQILDEMARATDTENWANLVALDMKIHETVYQLADSPMLLKVWETLRIGVFPLNESSQL